MVQLTPQFSTSRVLREYTETYYLLAAQASRTRSADRGKVSAEMVAQRQLLSDGWDALRFGEVKVQTDATHYVFRVRVDLGHLDPGLIRLELYAEGVGHGAPVRLEMHLLVASASEPSACVFETTVPADRLSTDYTARAISNEAGLAIPLEDARIRWQR